MTPADPLFFCFFFPILLLLLLCISFPKNNERLKRAGVVAHRYVQCLSTATRDTVVFTATPRKWGRAGCVTCQKDVCSFKKYEADNGFFFFFRFCVFVFNLETTDRHRMIQSLFTTLSSLITKLTSRYHSLPVFWFVMPHARLRLDRSPNFSLYF